MNHYRVQEFAEKAKAHKLRMKQFHQKELELKDIEIEVRILRMSTSEN